MWLNIQCGKKFDDFKQQNEQPKIIVIPVTAVNLNPQVFIATKKGCKA